MGCICLKKKRTEEKPEEAARVYERPDLKEISGTAINTEVVLQARMTYNDDEEEVRKKKEEMTKLKDHLRLARHDDLEEDAADSTDVSYLSCNTSSTASVQTISVKKMKKKLAGVKRSRAANKRCYKEYGKKYDEYYLDNIC